MVLYRFASSEYATVLAFTGDVTGRNLPVDYAPWHSVDGGNGVEHGTLAPSIMESIGLTGHFLLCGGGRWRDRPLL
jgi:hypothetical protein